MRRTNKNGGNPLIRLSIALLIGVCLARTATCADETAIASVETYGLHHVERKKVLDVANLDIREYGAHLCKIAVDAVDQIGDF